MQKNEEKKKSPTVKDLAVPAMQARELKGGEDILPTRANVSFKKKK